MAMEDTKPKETTPETEPIISWSIHPAKQRPWVTVAVIVFILIIAVGIYTWTLSPVFTAIATMILIGSLSGYFFPTGYRFYDDSYYVIVMYMFYEDGLIGSISQSFIKQSFDQTFLNQLKETVEYDGWVLYSYDHKTGTTYYISGKHPLYTCSVSYFVKYDVGDSYSVTISLR